MTYLSVGMLAKYYGVHSQTIRKWCRNGNLSEHHRTTGNHRRFEKPREPEGLTIGYVRVSSADQKKDLDVQAEALNEKAKAQSIKIDSTISDIGSGMNYKKRGFKQLLNNTSRSYAQRQIAAIRLGDHIHDMQVVQRPSHNT